MRLVALQDDMAWAENKTQVGRTLDVLVADGEGRKDGATAPALRPRPRQPARALRGAGSAGAPRPGDVVDVEVTYAAPHHLVADGALGGVRRTRAGDAWELRSGAAPATAGVLLGMPGIGAP